MTPSAVVRRLYLECINADRPELFAELVSPAYVGVTGERGPGGIADVIATVRAAVPDVRYTVDDVFDDGRKVAVRWTWRGTFAGPFRGIAPTNQPMTNTAIAIYEVADGKIIRAWMESDRLGFLQQAGVIAPEVGRPPTR